MPTINLYQSELAKAELNYRLAIKADIFRSPAADVVK